MLARSERVVLAAGLDELAGGDALLSALDEAPCVVDFGVLVDVGAPHFVRVNGDVRPFEENGAVGELGIFGDQAFEAD